MEKLKCSVLAEMGKKLREAKLNVHGVNSFVKYTLHEPSLEIEGRKAKCSILATELCDGVEEESIWGEIETYFDFKTEISEY